jgi:hypothetical protein
MAIRLRLLLAVSCCALSIVAAPTADAGPAATDPTGNYSGGPVPTVNGIPCVGGSLGVCIAMRQNAPGPRPGSSIGHSPTVTR